jgi:hypothetical protein
MNKQPLAPHGDALKLVEQISDNASDIRGDWSDPRTELRNIQDCCDSLRKLLSAPSEIGAFEQKYPRVIKSTDCHCPSCGHNRCASATSSIDNEDGTHYCQRCSAEWREVP